jgi:Zn-dependent protease with chaperone function
MNEAMNVIDRKPSYIGIDPNATPVISEEGLKRFRESNKQYHLARDSHLKNADQLAAAENSFRKAAFTYEKARESMMKVMKRENVNLEELRATMTKAFNRLRELDFARQKTRLDVDIAGVAVAWTNSLRRFSLKSLTNPDPATQKFPEILEHEKKHNKLSYGEQKEFKRLLPKRRAWAIAHDKILFLDYQRISNPALQARVENLVSRVRALSPIPDHPKHVQIIGQPRTPHPVDIDGKEREIYTLGDTIYFGIEYFDHKPSDDEIMFIAGHEMAHMYLNHSQLTMVAKMEDLDNPVPIFTEPYDYKSLGSPTLSKMEQNWIRNNARKARMQEFNQEKEFSSDRFGFHLALGAGARPNGIREAMDWIRNENKRSLTQLAKARAFGGKGIPNAELKTMKQTATHAEPDERLKRLRDIYGSVIDMVPSKP